MVWCASLRSESSPLGTGSSVQSRRWEYDEQEDEGAGGGLIHVLLGRAKIAHVALLQPLLGLLGSSLLQFLLTEASVPADQEPWGGNDWQRAARGCVLTSGWAFRRFRAASPSHIGQVVQHIVDHSNDWVGALLWCTEG